MALRPFSCRKALRMDFFATKKQLHFFGRYAIIHTVSPGQRKEGGLFRMSKKEALVERLLSKPTDFTERELDTIMGQCGCVKDNKGKTSGSRICYYHIATKQTLRLHSPHPGSVLKPYQVNDALSFLRQVGELPDKLD